MPEEVDQALRIRFPEKLKVFDVRLPPGSLTSMDQEYIKEKEEKIKEWMADKQHRRSIKAALCAANAVVLMGLTAGLAILWINELHRANGQHRGCPNQPPR